LASVLAADPRIPAADNLHPRALLQARRAALAIGIRCTIALHRHGHMQAYAEQVGGLEPDAQAAAFALIDEVSAEYPTGVPRPPFPSQLPRLRHWLRPGVRIRSPLRLV
jgi:hypothetical protein